MDIDCITQTAEEIHQTAVDHGFWDKPRNFGEMLALMHSELSEALEAHRSHQPVFWLEHKVGCASEGDKVCDCNPKPEGAAVEIIDCIIRCFDTAADLLKGHEWTVGEVMAMKMMYNNEREHMHGKAY